MVSWFLASIGFLTTSNFKFRTRTTGNKGVVAIVEAFEFCDVHTSEIVNELKQMTRLTISANGFLDTNSTIFTHSLVHLKCFYIMFFALRCFYMMFLLFHYNIFK